MTIKAKIMDFILDNISLQNSHFFKTPLMNVFIIPKGIDCATVYMMLVYLKARGFDKKRLEAYHDEIEKYWDRISDYKFLKNVI